MEKYRFIEKKQKGKRNFLERRVGYCKPAELKRGFEPPRIPVVKTVWSENIARINTLFSSEDKATSI